MASPRFPRNEPQRLENKTRRFSCSSDLAQAKSMVCVRVAPFPNQRNMRFSATTPLERRIAALTRHLRRNSSKDQDFEMDDIVTEHAGNILRVQLNRPTKRNAMTSAM